jgi:hypothetical protein
MGALNAINNHRLGLRMGDGVALTSMAHPNRMPPGKKPTAGSVKRRRPSLGSKTKKGASAK